MWIFLSGSMRLIFHLGGKKTRRPKIIGLVQILQAQSLASGQASAIDGGIYSIHFLEFLCKLDLQSVSN